MVAGDERDADKAVLELIELIDEEMAKGFTEEEARQRALARVREELTRRRRTRH